MSDIIDINVAQTIEEVTINATPNLIEVNINNMNAGKHSDLILDDGTNPHSTTKTDVGLSSVPNLDTTNAVNLAHTHSNFTALNALSGTNTGDETTLSIQTKRPLKTINNTSLEGSGNIEINVDNLNLEGLNNVTSTNYTTPIDTDSLLTYDITNSLWKRLSWLNIKSNLKTYFDGIYTTTSAVATQITTALSGYATQAWVTSQGYITNVITALGFTPENVANKSTLTTLGTSDTLYPTQNAVKTYADTKLDRITTGSVRRVYAVDASNNQEMIPVSELVGNIENDLYRSWVSYSANNGGGFVLDGTSNALTVSGTNAVVGRSGTTIYNSLMMNNYVSGTGAGANAGVKNNNFADGSFLEGFDAYFIFANNDTNVNCQTNIGFYSLISAIPNLATTDFTTNFVGIGNDVGDVNLSFYCKRTTATASYIKVPTNSSFPAHTTTDAYLLRMECNRTLVDADRIIKLTLTNIVSGAIISHTFTGVENPTSGSVFLITANRSNRNTGVATNLRVSKIHVTRKLY